MPDVPGRTVGVGTVDNRLTDNAALTGVGIGHFDRIQCLDDLGVGEVVVVGVLHGDFGVQPVDVIAPGAVDVAADAEDAAEGGVPQVLVTRAAFHVAAQQGDRRCAVIVQVRGVAEQDVALLVGQEGVGGAQVKGHTESTGGRDLRVGAVVHEAQFGVGLDMLVDLVAAEDTTGVTLVGALIVVQRAVVEDLVAGHELVAVDVVGARLGEEGTLGAGAGAAAGSNGHAQRAGGVVALALQDRIDFPVAGIGGDVAAAVVKVAAHDQRPVLDVAIGLAAVGYGEAGTGNDILDAAVVVVVLVLAELVVELDAFEVILHHEVDHAGDRV